jgi:hypothetical protein
MSDKFYFRLLGTFVAVLVFSLGGLVAYLRMPPPLEPEMRFLRLPNLSSPTFKYVYTISPGGDSDPVWREVGVSPETGNKVLRLLRGSKNTTVVLEQYYLKHPEAKKGIRQFSTDEFVGTLDVYENGSEVPTLSFEFLISTEFFFTPQSGEMDMFVVSPQRRAELYELVDEIKMGRKVIEEPPEHKSP